MWWLSDSSGTLESYDYLGVDTVVRRAHPIPGVDLTAIKQSGESNGDAGDQYTGFDRFGRVLDQRWLKTSDGTNRDRVKYGYDRDSNRLWRDNLVNTAFGELYSYDSLNELTSFQRGTLNGSKDGLTGSAARAQSWNLDALGNFATQTTDGTAQTRSHNQQNQITAVSGGTTPTYDARPGRHLLHLGTGPSEPGSLRSPTDVTLLRSFDMQSSHARVAPLVGRRELPYQFGAKSRQALPEGGHHREACQVYLQARTVIFSTRRTYRTDRGATPINPWPRSSSRLTPADTRFGIIRDQLRPVKKCENP